MAVTEIALTYLGAKQGSAQHHKLVDTFNTVKPNGEVANYTCAWCAIASTAWLILDGYTKSEVPMSYNCGTLVSIAKDMKLWVEDDNYLPTVGDRIIYNWNDDGKGDCTTGASHVGVVLEVSGNTFVIIEGNYSTKKTVAKRTITRNQIYIRGYIKTPAKGVTPKVTKKKYTGVLPKLPKRGYFIKGDKSDQVKNVQRFLNWALANTKGFIKLKVDGSYGTNTAKMVKLFEKVVGIKQDSKFGKDCLKKAKSFKR